MQIDMYQLIRAVVLVVQAVSKPKPDTTITLPRSLTMAQHPTPKPAVAIANKQAMPTTTETADELRRRLGKELYRMELDLMGGGRIAGKPCDCLSKKHTLGLEATAEELMSYEKNPVYGDIISWLKDHAQEFEPAEIGKRQPDYYFGLVPEIRNFRKKVMGTDNLVAIISPQEDVIKVRMIE
jgi:hypothetical protein